MSNGGTQRRLAAILAADVVGYSRLMGQDEAGTLAALKALRSEVIDPKVAEHSGRVFKSTGDGCLAEFPSVVNAVSCAVAIQQGVRENTPNSAVQLRIGINVGDVIVEAGDVFGDGVNVAARVESIAPPGGIALTETARNHLASRLKLDFTDTGTHSLKNIEMPIRVFVTGGAGRSTRTSEARVTDKPSIAVLPFTNMSSDPEQDYFADGLAEDLITDLSKVPGLLVIARNSTFAYKGKAVDMRLVARELGVRYVIEGSVRRSATRVRINAQLIDARENTHLWADRFDRDLTDVFLLQDEVVGKIVNALADALPTAHFPGRQRATNLKAYDLFVRGRELVLQSPESNRVARPLLEKSIELDPRFAEAHAWLAMSHAFGWLHGGEDEETNRPLALAAAKRAVALDAENSDAHALLGYVLLFDGKSDEGAAEFATALRINPNHADALVFQGEMYAHEGMADRGVETILKAFRLNPYPPGRYYWILGYAQYAAGHYEDAVQTLRHKETHLTGSSRILAASLAQLGQLEEAREEARRFLTTNPHFSVRHWAKTQPFRHDSDRQHFIEGYVKAGLPM